jgi:hypothetical protein
MKNFKIMSFGDPFGDPFIDSILNDVVLSEDQIAILLDATNENHPNDPITMEELNSLRFIQEQK